MLSPEMMRYIIDPSEQVPEENVNKDFLTLPLKYNIETDVNKIKDVSNNFSKTIMLACKRFLRIAFNTDY